MNSPRSDWIVISPGAYIALAAMLLMLPVVWGMSICVAILIHELFHWVAIRMCGGTVHRFCVRAGGIYMDIAPMTPGRELVCALAGPFGSALLACFARHMPLIGFCALIQGAFNLLPVYPLDGGRAVRNFLELVTHPAQAERISGRISVILILCLFILGIWCMVRWSTGILPVLLPAFLWRRTAEKSPRLFRTRRSRLDKF